MANCTKCSAELIGSAKFCASCGAPIPQAPSHDQAPNTVAPATTVGNVSITTSDSFEPASPVNPFAATASPNSPASLEARASLAAALSNLESSAQKLQEQSQAQPPPAAQAETSNVAPTGSQPPPGEPPPISPLAVSNALSQRGAFQQALENAKDMAAQSQAGQTPKKKKPGTQLMQNAPSRPVQPEAKSPAPPPAEAPPAKKAPPRTVAMNFNAMQGGGAPQSVAPGAQSVLQPQPQSVVAPSGAPGSQIQRPPSSPNAFQPSGVQSVAQPSSGVQGPAMGQPPAQHASAYGAPPYPQQQQAPYPAPAAQPQSNWGWNAQTPPTPFQQPYGFGFPPGARVHVTWSNGQRYPATVSQVSGTQCLVVFPDGQQHWVEMQYLAPG